jgi:beta-galactosidase
MRGVNTDEIPQLVPAQGVTLEYAVKVPAPGHYRFWARIGWFNARADFEWRLGDGPWQVVPHDFPTTNLMELGFFCEISWVDLGDVRLERDTTLQIRYPKATGDKARMLMAADCFAFVQGGFLPDGPFKPGESYDQPQDRQAAAHVFPLPPPDSAARTSVELSGLWQVARFDDPDMDRDTYEPVRELPQGELRWMGFQVPGNPWQTDPLVFGHRLIYRTKVQVPEAANRSFRLHFSGTNWIVSVFVNGQLAGTHTGVWVPWDLDITPYVKPGQVNELAVAVKGTYYAMDAEAMGGKSIHAIRNRPLDRKEWTRWVAPMYPSTKGDGNGYIYGIVNPVTLISTGEVYTEDVFVKPSVQKKSLELEYTLRCTSARFKLQEILIEAIDDKTGQVEKSWTEHPAPLGKPGAVTLKVSFPWENPKLWWPQPEPQLYRLRTTLRDASGKASDVHEQLFGFREVTLQGTGLYINGARRNFWNWVDASADTITKPEDWADAWRRDRSRFIRFSTDLRISRVLPSREERLEFFDRQGIPGRLCTMIDGMFISFRLLDRSGSGENRVVKPNEVVWKNFREHIAQVARAYRNHPSIILYQAENELVYINGMNLYGDDLGLIEQAMHEVVEEGRKHDPTRPFTVGGGGDLSGRLEINAPHYPTATLDYYPENAYTIDHYATKIERWPWDRSKPWHVGECSFASHLEYGTLVAGSQASRSKQHAREAKAKYLRMLYGGYRWAGVHAFFPWDNLAEFPDSQKVFSDLCAIPRKQTHRLFGGRHNELLFKIMNDTFSRAPVTFQWSYAIGGRTVAEGRQVMDIEPGFGQEHSLAIDAPAVEQRVDGHLRLRVSQAGAADYVDDRLVPTLPSETRLRLAGDVFVYDRGGSVAKYLQAAGQPFTPVDSLDAVRGKQGVLVVGADTLTPDEAFGPGLVSFAVRGGRVICLEQETPPAGAALPAPVRPTTRFGGYAHPNALGTAVFRDLGADDLIDWAGDHPTYKAVYQKPSQGARALAVAGSSLEFSPLLEVPCGEGVIVLCQLRVGAKLGLDPAADILLRNLLQTYGEYRPANGVAAFFGAGNALLRDRLARTGILLEDVASLDAALDPAKYAVAIVDATPDNLANLTRLANRVVAFQDAGRWIMLTNVTRDGMPAFNRLVGGNFLLRPFRMENVTLNHNEFRLAATLSDADVALHSPERIMHDTYWVSQDTFGGVIDATRDFGRFTLPPGAPDDPFVYQPTRDDHDPYNFVNGLMADDSWRYTQQIWIGEDNTTGDLVFRLRKPEQLKTVQIWNLDTYGTINDLDVILDGDDSNAIHMRLPNATELTTLELPEPRRVERTITLRPKTWALKGRRNNEGQEIRLVGINNVALLRPEEPRGAVALDSVGGLVAFPRGAGRGSTVTPSVSEGGIFLNQVRFLEEEPKPANEAQKIRVVGTILGNMGVGFRTAATVAVPGVNVRYFPLNLENHGNTYLDAKRGERAWFGEPAKVDLALLPRGKNDFADVTYHVTDYATAPTPDAIILGGAQPRWNPANVRELADRVTGIRVGRKADVLYFLHTAHVAGPVTDREREQMSDRRRPFELPVVMNYVLHYTDGQSREIPVVLERHIDHWVQSEPKPLLEARLGWQQRLDGLDGRFAVLYSVSATNPRPEVEITTIDLIRSSPRAVPAVLGITLGEIVRAK